METRWSREGKAAFLPAFSFLETLFGWPTSNDYPLLSWCIPNSQVPAVIHIWGTCCFRGGGGVSHSVDSFHDLLHRKLAEADRNCPQARGRRFHTRSLRSNFTFIFPFFLLNCINRPAYPCGITFFKER